MELNWRHCKIFPTMEQYITMVDNSMFDVESVSWVDVLT